MKNLKEKIQEAMKEMGADINNFSFKYYEKSPYQKARFKPEFVESELWVHLKKEIFKPEFKKIKSNRDYGYVIMESDFENKEYLSPYLEMILTKSKLFYNN